MHAAEQSWGSTWSTMPPQQGPCDASSRTSVSACAPLLAVGGAQPAYSASPVGRVAMAVPRFWAANCFLRNRSIHKPVRLV